MYKEYKTQHYIFHYQEGSPAEKDIKEIAREQESCFSCVCDTLNVVFPVKIHYWLCDTPDEVGRIYGDNEPCNGFAVEPDQIYAVYNDVIQCIGPHEDAHLISYQINIPDSVFLREGLAMFFDRSWWGIANREWAAYFRKKHLEKRLTELINDPIFDDINCAISYPIAGAFTEYLISRYGLEKYLEFYRCSDGNFLLKAEEVYGKTLGALDDDYWNYVDQESVDIVLERRMEELLKK